ncbi:glutamate receptor ionotropic, NMDA 2D-like isoform X6 [Phymastichus coffea]|uniref:glutamate receptor ionotropic, NMDA 2D-like isoform X6 n=1 Tax=Phymastichus coffea TaxID=108790 RepID=UPI00273C480B|nr:glutamate receptor ionotropic, NMDA 2D-like isoform X6 [Phymastichus coffea]
MRSGWSALAWLLLGSSLALGPRADDAGFGHGGSSGSGHPGAAQRTSSTIKIGKYDRSSGLGGLGGLGGTGQRGSSMIKIGEGSKLLNISRVVRPLLTTSMTSTTIPLSYASVSPESQGSAEFSNGTKMLKVGLAVPYKSFGYREYTKAVSRVVTALQKSTKRPNLGLFQHYDIFVKVAMQELTPSPMNILNSLCKEFLSLNVSAILYLMNYEQYGRSTASTQYFLQLAGYLGIPVIAWNADNSGLERIGAWKSWEKDGLDIKDIVWPGNTHTPPPGVPEKFHVKIAFLEEPPYINLAPPDPVTGKCLVERGVHCRVAKDPDEADAQAAARNGTAFQCCSGFCIDLLQKFSEEMGFTYELVRVEDGKWGTIENGKWNGLMAELVNRKTDMVMTSLKINSEREAVVDFSVPFMETGSAIVVAKRTGIISPTAFLEPFDTASWMLVGFVAIHSATFMIFLFEWLSPSSFGMPDYSAGTKPKPQRRQQHRQHQRQHQRHRYRHEREPLQQPAKPPRQQHRFSLCRVYWLVWAVLFQAAVHVDSPRGFTARFMTNVWAMFAVVFLAIYTANLAAFMITREEFFDFSGVDDQRLARPTSHKPPIKFGTVPFTHTDSVLAKYFKEMYAYMRTHSKGSVSEGVEAVVNGDLDAFIYDGTVIDYLVSQDQDCRLLTVGSWYAMTGYGLAFPRNSRFLKMFNQKLLEYRDNGDLERLRRFWMTGTCRPDKEVQKSSDPLALEQFLSAFLMLMVGTLIAAFLLLLEHLYSTYVRRRLAKDARAGRCCGLLSSVSTRSSPAPPSLHARLSCACSASRPAPPRRGDSSEPSRRRLFLEAAARRLGHAGTPRREGRLGRAQPWLSRMCTAAFLRCSTCYK